MKPVEAANNKMMVPVIKEDNRVPYLNRTARRRAARGLTKDATKRKRIYDALKRMESAQADADFVDDLEHIGKKMDEPILTKDRDGEPVILATGGIITDPKVTLVGERGPE